MATPSPPAAVTLRVGVCVSPDHADDGNAVVCEEEKEEGAVGWATGAGETNLVPADKGDS